jgi:signal transduction protein with GAF and PtsI domain
LNADRVEKFGSGGGWETVAGLESARSPIVRQEATESVAVVASAGSDTAVAATTERGAETTASAVNAGVSGGTAQVEHDESTDGDVLKMTLEVKEETDALRTAIGEKLKEARELRERFEDEMDRADVKAERFVDTPSDLPDLM